MKVPKGCFGTAQRTDVGMKYLALNGNKLFVLTGFEAEIKITDMMKKYKMHNLRE